ncbi:hypothetical protein FHX82_005265 [Amycolatopsis bartoniae]|uniref:Uncharacterized protein n=1 Tax=Amycolatopsis bartoniae TaxID=941986 RepID=A0A8H9IU48_9PSEU|nr:hypothetical protein [Amycolatopsis bartoniae]MBB2938189.1 hypothetical protein [Amycolatopsis bartoniae]TVT03210.1 hypothetical protein FNH07_25780 [Amycolatopsis bartoniae]GHF33302.1 hypothetical protein GCM10017566_02420 [Amycolatopsis bartoniae]
MNRTTTHALLTAAAMGTALALTQAPASAAPRDESGWIRAQDFGSSYFCQAAGMAGQFAGRWLPGQWQCVGPVLYLRNDPLVVFN